MFDDTKIHEDTELVPIAASLDKNHSFPATQVSKLGELGLMGISVDTEYGGSGEAAFLTPNIKINQFL